MTIRELNKNDFPQVIAIEKLTQAAPWSEETFMRCWEANYHGWVREIDSKIVGFLLLSLKAGECHILNLSIHPEVQRQGLGIDLMNYGLKWAKQEGAGIVYLEVRRSNKPAIGLYRKMNFKLIGERKNYYLGPQGAEDALVFARDIGVEI